MGTKNNETKLKHSNSNAKHANNHWKGMIGFIVLAFLALQWSSLTENANSVKNEYKVDANSTHR